MPRLLLHRRNESGRSDDIRQAKACWRDNRGRIIESGSHAELMARQGFYDRLHQAQPGGGPAPAQ